MNRVIYWVGGFVLVVMIGAFCWQPPHSPGDIAGWVQAFGSIVAVALAVWLQYEARTERFHQAIKLAMTFSHQLLACIDGLQQAMRTQNWARYIEMRTLMESWAKTDVPMAELPPNTLAAVVTLRSMAITKLSTTPLVNVGTNWNHWDNEFGNMGHDARQVLRAAGVVVPDKGFSP